MFSLFIEAIAGLSRSLTEALFRLTRPSAQPILIVDPVRLWSAEQEHYWDRRDW
jgi:hypothetical protein